MIGLLQALMAKQGDEGVKWGPSPYPAPTPVRPPLSSMYQGARGKLDSFYGPRPSGMVDQVENGVAAIVDPETGKVIHMSARDLPPGAREGSWTKDRKTVKASPSKAAEIRRHQSAADPGGDFAL